MPLLNVAHVTELAEHDHAGVVEHIIDLSHCSNYVYHLLDRNRIAHGDRHGLSPADPDSYR